MSTYEGIAGLAIDAILLLNFCCLGYAGVLSCSSCYLLVTFLDIFYNFA
ncbi:hypothetical protein PCIT_a4332 [Pseudoalteromonas citrea]|uniref:Uncharacterized protein n=1 Tax=Pseudoalteromonas citrea TaxID=43655 RepID=A0AAD4FS00_9GAMM|nr:hypothetical protein PCIT_a4332 [Pseudoalteromonas citrea]